MSIIKTEKESIQHFVSIHSRVLVGYVLDFGCGQQPYRQIVVDAGGSYHGYDRTNHPAAVCDRDYFNGDPLFYKWDSILCTQVIQYVPDPQEMLRLFHAALLDRNGHLVITGPTCWREIEPESLWFFTQTGIRTLLERAGFDVLELCSRASITPEPGFTFSFGWGAVAQA
jgi:hypothetical protein